MDVQLREEPIGALAELAQVPIAFTVDRVLDVTASDTHPGQPVLRERRLSAPYVKDYDALPGAGPDSWARRFDVSRWKLLVARTGDRWYKELRPLGDQPHSAFMLPYSFRLQDWDRRCSMPPDRPPPRGSHARS